MWFRPIFQSDAQRRDDGHRPVSGLLLVQHRPRYEGLLERTNARKGHRPKSSLIAFALLLISLIFFIKFAHAEASPATFAECADRLLAEATTRGVSSLVIDSVKPLLREDTRIVSLDRSQPEFMQTFAGYFPVRVNNQRIDRGRELLREHQSLLQRIQRETGVPPQYLLAFWGLETDFGRVLGSHIVPVALANLACDSRRADFFREEFIKSLRILDRGDITVDRMLGSWAGAMGNMQFMPSAYLDHATDGDKDGKRDLWNSTTDALVSAGYFLSALGWTTGQRWGREVLLPSNFDYLQTDKIEPLSAWANMGVRDTAGRPLKQTDTPARIIVPSGHQGPAFIAYPNFDVIMKWNRSEYYAISVGRLADQIAGGGKLVRPIPDIPERLPLESIRTLQENLALLGFEVGPIDGLAGPATRRAIAAWQHARGWIPDGFTHPETLSALGDAPVPSSTTP